jgi:hypothetical protein
MILLPAAMAGSQASASAFTLQALSTHVGPREQVGNKSGSFSNRLRAVLG